MAKRVPWLLTAASALLASSIVVGAPNKLLVQGLDLFRQGRYELAEPLLREGLKVEPSSLEASLALVKLYLGWSDWERALPVAQRAVALDPRSSEAHLRLAQSYGVQAVKVSRLRAVFLGDDIRREFETAVALDPASIEARNGLMLFYMVAPAVAGGSLGRALAQAEAIVPLDPVRGYRAVARVRQEQGRGAEALAALERLATHDAGQARLGRAFYFQRAMKDATRAAAELVKLVEEDSSDAVDLTAGAVMLIDMSRWQEALTLLDRAVAADPGYLLASYHIGRACLLSGHELPRAEAAFRRYLSVESLPQTPSHASAHWWLGRVYAAMGRTAEVRRETAEAVRLEPGNAEFRKSLD